MEITDFNLSVQHNATLPGLDLGLNYSAAGSAGTFREFLPRDVPDHRLDGNAPVHRRPRRHLRRRLPDVERRRDVHVSARPQRRAGVVHARADRQAPAGAPAARSGDAGRERSARRGTPGADQLSAPRGPAGAARRHRAAAESPRNGGSPSASRPRSTCRTCRIRKRRRATTSSRRGFSICRRSSASTRCKKPDRFRVPVQGSAFRVHRVLFRFRVQVPEP